MTHRLTEPIITCNLNIFVITKVHSTDKEQTTDLMKMRLFPKNAYVTHLLTKIYKPPFINPWYGPWIFSQNI